VEENPPYTYWLGRNLKTGESHTFTKRDEIALEKIAVRCGEIFHNLKSALDHTYFKAVSPHVIESKHKSIIFPFVKDSSHLEERMHSTHANKVNDEFYETILELKPHGGDDGNVLLYLIHQINISDKHRALIPFADLTSVSSEKIQSEVPDFPQGINIQSSNTHKHVVWFNNKYHICPKRLKKSSQ